MLKFHFISKNKGSSISLSSSFLSSSSSFFPFLPPIFLRKNVVFVQNDASILFPSIFIHSCQKYYPVIYPLYFLVLSPYNSSNWLKYAGYKLNDRTFKVGAVKLDVSCKIMFFFQIRNKNDQTVLLVFPGYNACAIQISISESPVV